MSQVQVQSIVRRTLRRLFDNQSLRRDTVLSIPGGAPGDPCQFPSIYCGSSFVAKVRFDAESGWTVMVPVSKNNHWSGDTFTEAEWAKVVRAFDFHAESVARARAW